MSERGFHGRSFLVVACDCPGLGCQWRALGIWDDETCTRYPVVRIPKGITQEMVDAVRLFHPTAADILQALLDAGGDDE